MFHTRNTESKDAVAEDPLSPVKPHQVDPKDSFLDSPSVDSTESNEKNGEIVTSSPFKEKQKAMIRDACSKDIISNGESTDDNLTPNQKIHEDEIKERDSARESRPSILKVPKYGKEYELISKPDNVEFKAMLHNGTNNKVSFKEDTDVITVENWKQYNRHNTYDGRSCNCNIF